ncbi:MULTISPECIES: Fis family transcriptional regulator [Thalassotalea]|uniref:Fis family transcriptional regulator n=1 Tax=Thalassotalea castellviae TaxID=3075612 RepID=A0ABU3A5B6_9GAMM|nr:Fis family transcriptional regulator [Thalassotalea sp. W431]MDT0605363.1 Fis family transcriptional regulator [Thalassotalea sp. W431]
MKLTKTTQKLDNNICKALTIACENSLHKIAGFSWLTHRANYTNFPASLIVTCVFETENDIEEMKAKNLATAFQQDIQKQLLKIGVIVKNVNQCIHFDSEEACEKHHQGQWSERLKLKTTKQKPNINNRRMH